jgi:16S rRNA (guanine(966)-N(2))-methyltransferase RsmD
VRVIAGEFRSRRLKALPGMATRPTPDRLRESLFSILAPRLAGAIFLDVYAGTGAVGIEALSRGAARAIFLESSRAAVDIIRQNLKSLGIEDRAEIVTARAHVALARLSASADIVFVDPPYELAAEYERSLAALAETRPGLVIVQHAARVAMPEARGSLRRVRVLRQGDSALSLFEPA